MKITDKIRHFNTPHFANEYAQAIDQRFYVMDLLGIGAQYDDCDYWTDQMEQALSMRLAGGWSRQDRMDASEIVRGFAL